MQPLEFSCPHCQATLRLQDEELLHAVLPCPDCGRGLRVECAEAAAEDECTPSVVVKAARSKPPSGTPEPALTETLPEPAESVPGRRSDWGIAERAARCIRRIQRRRVGTSSRRIPRMPEDWSRHLSSPVVIAWTTALAGALLLAVIIWAEGWAPSSRQRTGQLSQSEQPDAGAEDSPAPVTADTEQSNLPASAVSSAIAAPVTERDGSGAWNGEPQLEAARQTGSAISDPALSDPALSDPRMSDPAQFWTDAGQLLQRLMADSDTANAGSERPSGEEQLAQGEGQREAAIKTEVTEPADPNATLPEAMRPRPPLTAEQLAARLQQPLTWFELSEPTPLRQQLEFFEALLETPLEFSDAVEARLERNVQISERDTTVEAVLRSLLAQLDLEMEIDGRRIRIREVRATDGSASQQRR